MTGLKKTAEEVGVMEFPAVIELLDYWLEYPPEHLLIRAQIGYEGKKTRSNWRSRRAEEMGDMEYIEAQPEPEAIEADKGHKTSFVPDIPGIKQGGARHLDCAPPHIQQAIERLKQNKHMDVPRS